jgi:DNA-binding NtrC family response regulator
MSTSRSASTHLTYSPTGLGPTLARDEFGIDESGIVGSSEAIKRLRQQVRRIGPHFRAVLVSGEAGTGKELVARALHRMSPASNGPFVVCHAAAMNNVFAKHRESDGTEDDVRDLMRSSARGTLFLDGISDLTSEVQGWLLRALTQYELAQKTDLRIIASTREDLRILVSTGRFSQELYRRLATVDIILPPLRERMEDLPELARHLLKRIAQFYGRAVLEIGDETMGQMRSYLWPENVGELESVLRNSVLGCPEEVLQPHHLPPFPAANHAEDRLAPASKSIRLEDVIGQHVLRVLKDCGGNKLRASEMLGISRSTLYRMLDTGAIANGLR